MQKFIRILAIAAAVLVALSFLLILVSFPLQRVIAGTWLQYPDSILGIMPIFPLDSFVNCFLLLGCMILLVVCCGNKKGGIWLEILVLAAMVLVLPSLSTLLSYVQNIIIAMARGEAFIAANSVASRICAYCMYPGNLGRSIALVVIGMSIAFKHMNKKMAKAVIE